MNMLLGTIDPHYPTLDSFYVEQNSELFMKIHSMWTELGLQISSIWLRDLVDKCFTIWTSPSNTCVLVPWPFRLLHQYRRPYRGEGSRCLFSHLFLVIYSLFLSNILLLLFMSFTNNNISNNILVVSITLSFSVQSQLRDLNVGGSAIVRLYPSPTPVWRKNYVSPALCG